MTVYTLQGRYKAKNDETMFINADLPRHPIAKDGHHDLPHFVSQWKKTFVLFPITDIFTKKKSPKFSWAWVRYTNMDTRIRSMDYCEHDFSEECPKNNRIPEYARIEFMFKLQELTTQLKKLLQDVLINPNGQISGYQRQNALKFCEVMKRHNVNANIADEVETLLKVIQPETTFTDYQKYQLDNVFSYICLVDRKNEIENLVTDICNS